MVSVLPIIDYISREVAHTASGDIYCVTTKFSVMLWSEPPNEVEIVKLMQVCLVDVEGMSAFKFYWGRMHESNGNRFVITLRFDSGHEMGSPGERA